jgi:hypothetical protein
MRLIAYTILLFSVSLMLYLLGYTNLLSYYAEQQGGPMDFVGILKTLAKALLSDEGLSVLLGVAITGLIATILGGFGAMYIFPMLTLLVFANYLLFPLSFLLDQDMPEIVKLPLVVFFNLLTLLTVITFVRGGG